MAENGSVGIISLDLVIKEKITEQIDKIKSKVSTPAAKVGEAVQEAIEKPAEKAAEAVNKSVEKTISAEQNAADKLTNIVEKLVAEIREKLNNVDFSTGMEQKFTAVLDTMTQKFDLLQKKWQELATGDPFGESATKLNTAAQAISDAAKKLGSIKKPEPVVPDKPVPEQYGERWEKSFRQVRNSGSKAFSFLSKAGGKALTALKSRLSGLGKSVSGKALTALKSRLSGLGKSVSSLTDPVKKLGRTLANTFKRVFVAAAIYGAFRALKDGILETAKADEQFCKSLDEVKQNLAVAFAPIMQAIMPALNSMMSGLAAVTGQIAAFIAGLFGQTYKQAAETAKKLKSVTDAAKKAKLSLAGIDEMNILSSGDSGENGASSGAADIPEPVLPDWAEELKNKLRGGDWYGVGAMFAKGINKALGSVDWDKLSSKVNTGVSKITDGINGFLDNIDWGTLGDTLAGGLNTLSGAIETFSSRVHWDRFGSGIAQGLNRAIKKTKWRQLGRSLGGCVQSVISTAYSFALKFDWSGFGNAVGDTINGWFEAVDFSQAAQTLSLGVIGVLQTASAAADRTDWLNIGKKLSDALNNIDIVGISGEFAHTLSNIITGALDLAIGFVENTKWNKLASKLFDSLGAMLRNINWGGLVTRAFRLAGAAVAAKLTLAVTFVRKVWETIVTAFKSVASSINQKIEECGGWTIEGIYNGITDALKGVGTWIRDHIFKPFIDGFKNAFGIASPSKVMAEMGGYLIDGLYNAVSDGISRVTEIFGKLLAAVKGVFDGIGDWFGSVFGGAWDCVKQAFSISNASQFFGEVWSGIKKAFGDVAHWFEKTFSEAWTKVKNVFSKGGEAFKGISEGIYTTFKKIVDYLIDGINEVVAIPFEAINDALQGIKDVKIGSGRFAVEPFSFLPTIDVPKIPHLPALAEGGLAAAPTLAMVGDNRNASVDPEVISPLSKLQGMVGADPEVIELLRIIVELLRSGMNIEIINYMFRNSREFSREVIKAVAEDNARRGG